MLDIPKVLDSKVYSLTRSVCNLPQVLDSKVYPLIRSVYDLPQVFLVEEQKKGYIYSSSLSYTALVFFISKKDSDKKRIIMNY